MDQEQEKEVQEETNEEIIEKESKMFDYQHAASFKVSEKFKERFMTRSAGGPTMSVDGLVALGHVKGIWKIDVDILQYPNTENGRECICKAFVGGYGWDPIEEKIIRVEFSDIGDASPANTNGQVAKALIRMAGTRAIGRALRKYTNIDMVCTEELDEEDIATESMSAIASEPLVDISRLTTMKNIMQQKGIDKQMFDSILIKTFNQPDFQQLTVSQADTMIQILNNYVPPNQ